jgi:hypothetical protein
MFLCQGQEMMSHNFFVPTFFAVEDKEIHIYETLQIFVDKH